LRAMKAFSHSGGDDKVPTDLESAIKTTLLVARNEYAHVADVVTDFAADLPPVPVVAGEFNQVILNLVVNAADAIAEAIANQEGARGTITISTRRHGDFVEVRVRDTGTGIPEAVRPRIFELFFTTKDVGKGTGQGLALSRFVIVNKHGGTIHFETETGRGTTFIIRLPVPEI
jgi:signal transduction histidine kinase